MRSPAPSRVALSIAVLTVALRPDAATAGPPFELRAPRSTTPPVIDGVVDDAEWAAAPVAGPFIQFEPRRGEPASHRTEARVLHDDGHLHVAFRVRDPESPTAQVTQRDQLNFNSDDIVAFYVEISGRRRPVTR